MKKPSICFVGPGSLAATLGRWLHEAGYPVEEIVGRSSSKARARALARRLGAQPTTLPDARCAAAVIWLTVPDDAISACARQLTPRGEWKGKIVLHSSGALTSDELAPLRQRGAAVASVHPMMTFVRGGRLASAKGIPFAIEGDPPAVRAATRMVRELGGGVVSIQTARKPLYHALGAFASPLIVAQLAVAEQIARAAGVPEGKVRSTIAPILRQTLENYLAHGTAVAFSGPLVRGDLGTIRKHLAVLKNIPEARDVYLALARAAQRYLPVVNRKELQRVLRRR